MGTGKSSRSSRRVPLASTPTVWRYSMEMMAEPIRYRPPLDASGDLFRTTNTGGADNDGVVFEIADGSSGFVDRYRSGVVTNRPARAESGEVVDSSGGLFGATFAGGARENRRSLRGARRPLDTPPAPTILAYSTAATEPRQVAAFSWTPRAICWNDRQRRRRRLWDHIRVARRAPAMRRRLRLWPRSMAPTGLAPTKP